MNSESRVKSEPKWILGRNVLWYCRKTKRWQSIQTFYLSVLSDQIKIGPLMETNTLQQHRGHVSLITQTFRSGWYVWATWSAPLIQPKTFPLGADVNESSLSWVSLPWWGSTDVNSNLTPALNFNPAVSTWTIPLSVSQQRLFLPLKSMTSLYMTASLCRSCCQVTTGNEHGNKTRFPSLVSDLDVPRFTGSRLRPRSAVSTSSAEAVNRPGAFKTRQRGNADWNRRSCIKERMSHSDARNNLVCQSRGNLPFPSCDTSPLYTINLATDVLWTQYNFGNNDYDGNEFHYWFIFDTKSPSKMF